MNTVEAAVVPENTEDNTEVTDTQVDQFFDNGGELPTEEAPEAEAKDEQADEVQEQAAPEETEVEQKDEKTVPYGALHEERMMRKEAAQEAAEMREKIARMEERFQAVMERTAPKEPEVDFADDPAEYLRKQAEATSQTLEELKAQQAQQAQAQQHAQEQNAFVAQYRAAANDYAEKNPEFSEAYGFLVSNRIKEHTLAGLSEAQATETAQREEQAIARMAFEQGVNPAERLMELAKVRGWSGVSSEKSGQNAPDKVKTIAEGQQAAKTISKGGAAKGEMTLEALADMDGADFDKAWVKMFGSD